MRVRCLDNVNGPMAAVCEQIIAESHGNPSRSSSCHDLELRTRRRIRSARRSAGREQDRTELRQAPPAADTRLLVLAAAAEPLGDPLLLQRAAESLGFDMSSIEPALNDGLLELGRRVEFAHPLVRSAAYRSARAEDRHRVHRALAEATDPERDPTAGPGIARAERRRPTRRSPPNSERSAARAHRRLAAAAAFLSAQSR